jgi:hypothetical protein
MMTKTADEMRGIHVKRAEDDHEAEHRHKPQADRPVFDRAAAEAMALKAVPADSQETFFYAWAYCPDTTVKTLPKNHDVDVSDGAFMRHE